VDPAAVAAALGAALVPGWVRSSTGCHQSPLQLTLSVNARNVLNRVISRAQSAI